VNNKLRKPVREIGDREREALGHMASGPLRQHDNRGRGVSADSPVVKSAPNGTESTVTVLKGAGRCVLARVGEDPAPGPSHPLGMRLRSGSTLFLPQDHTYRLSEIHAPTTLLELHLEGPG